MQVALELSNGQRLENFKEHDSKKPSIASKSLLVEIWTLLGLLVRAQKEMRNMVLETRRMSTLDS